jgi:hypothetical protein
MLFIGDSVDIMSTAKGVGFNVTAFQALQAPIESIVFVNGTIEGRRCGGLSAIGGSQKLAGNVIKKIRLSGSPNLTLSVGTVAVLDFSRRRFSWAIFASGLYSTAVMLRSR